MRLWLGRDLWVNIGDDRNLRRFLNDPGTRILLKAPYVLNNWHGYNITATRFVCEYEVNGITYERRILLDFKEERIN